MADPIDLVYCYFEKKRSHIRDQAEKKNKPSNLLARRKEKKLVIQSSPVLSKSSLSSSEEGS